MWQAHEMDTEPGWIVQLRWIVDDGACLSISCEGKGRVGLRRWRHEEYALVFWPEDGGRREIVDVFDGFEEAMAQFQAMTVQQFGGKANEEGE